MVSKATAQRFSTTRFSRDLKDDACGWGASGKSERYLKYPPQVF